MAAARKGLMLADTSALTVRQKEIYEFIRDKIVKRGYGPTVREIGDEFGIKSPNGVMCHLKALVKKQMITREPNLSRAISLTEETPILPIRINEKGIGNGGRERGPSGADRGHRTSLQGNRRARRAQRSHDKRPHTIRIHCAH